MKKPVVFLIYTKYAPDEAAGIQGSGRVFKPFHCHSTVRKVALTAPMGLIYFFIDFWKMSSALFAFSSAILSLSSALFTASSARAAASFAFNVAASAAALAA
jgi:hypothetical protein